MKVNVIDNVELSEVYTPVAELIKTYPFLENEKWDFVEGVTIFENEIVIDLWDKKISRIIWRWNGSRWNERAVILQPNVLF